ncbi:hypothetical protein MHU86_4429 [Fragilaria crotonensis]|nr:hypothetical protein MHU86_4429 [Fragilaria crotonensis]
MMSAQFPLIVLTLISSLASARVHDMTHRSPLRGRSLEVQGRKLQKSSNVVSTSECENLRTQPFAARLELEYLYLVESVVPLQNLKGVQNVNNRAILDALVTCDDKGFPLYGLDLSTPHEDVEQGYCIPQDRNNTCSVIRGRAFIYLDGGITNARDLAYLAVDKALSDPTFVVLFEPNVVYSRFLRSVQENILFVAADDPTKSDTVGAENESRSLTVKITIAISSVVFIVASIFALGFLRRQKQLNLRREQAEAQKEVRKKSRLDRRRYFQSLNGDDGIVAGPVVQLNSEQDGRSLIWSDITSDSGSVTSILSRTTAGRLQKIDEEPDHERHAEVEAKWDVQTPLSTQYTIAYSAHASRLQELVRKACSDEHDDDVETTIPQISTLTTEASFPTSFATDDDPLFPLRCIEPHLRIDPKIQQISPA